MEKSFFPQEVKKSGIIVLMALTRATPALDRLSWHLQCYSSCSLKMMHCVYIKISKGILSLSYRRQTSKLVLRKFLHGGHK